MPRELVKLKEEEEDRVKPLRNPSRPVRSTVIVGPKIPAESITRTRIVTPKKGILLNNKAKIQSKQIVGTKWKSIVVGWGRLKRRIETDLFYYYLLLVENSSKGKYIPLSLSKDSYVIKAFGPNMLSSSKLDFYNNYFDIDSTMRDSTPIIVKSGDRHQITGAVADPLPYSSYFNWANSQDTWDDWHHQPYVWVGLYPVLLEGIPLPSFDGMYTPPPRPQYTLNEAPYLSYSPYTYWQTIFLKSRMLNPYRRMYSPYNMRLTFDKVIPGEKFTNIGGNLYLDQLRVLSVDGKTYSFRIPQPVAGSYYFSGMKPYSFDDQGKYPTKFGEYIHTTSGGSSSDINRYSQMAYLWPFAPYISAFIKTFPHFYMGGRHDLYGVPFVEPSATNSLAYTCSYISCDDWVKHSGLWTLTESNATFESIDGTPVEYNSPRPSGNWVWTGTGWSYVFYNTPAARIHTDSYSKADSWRSSGARYFMIGLLGEMESIYIKSTWSQEGSTQETIIASNDKSGSTMGDNWYIYDNFGAASQYGWWALGDYKDITRVSYQKNYNCLNEIVISQQLYMGNDLVDSGTSTFSYVCGMINNVSYGNTFEVHVTVEHLPLQPNDWNSEVTNSHRTEYYDMNGVSTHSVITFEPLAYDSKVFYRTVNGVVVKKKVKAMVYKKITINFTNTRTIDKEIHHSYGEGFRGNMRSYGITYGSIPPYYDTLYETRFNNFVPPFEGTDEYISSGTRTVEYYLYTNIDGTVEKTLLTTGQFSNSLLTHSGSGKRIYGVSLQVEQDFIALSYERDIFLSARNIGNVTGSQCDFPVNLEDWNYSIMESGSPLPIWEAEKFVVTLINVADLFGSAKGYTVSKEFNPLDKGIYSCGVYSERKTK